jgi:hypothetical protein
MQLEFSRSYYTTTCFGNLENSGIYLLDLINIDIGRKTNLISLIS